MACKDFCGAWNSLNMMVRNVQDNTNKQKTILNSIHNKKMCTFAVQNANQLTR